MNKNITRTVAAVVALSFAGVSTPSCGNMSDSALAMFQGTSLGALGGGAAGAGIGAIAGGKDGVWIGAIAGSVLGAVAGNIWSRSVVKKKNQYAQVEDYFEANIDQLDDRIADAKKASKDLDKQIASLKPGSTMSKSERNAYQKKFNQNIALIDADLAAARTATRQKEISSSDAAKLKERISTLTSYKKDLQKKNNALLKSIRVA